MTQDIIALAREAGIRDCICNGKWGCLERFAELVAAKEREACAKVCDYRHDEWRFGDGEDSISGPKECAAAIRARGET